MIFKAFLIWIVIAIAETLNGVLRVRLLNPRVGDKSARRISLFSGSTIILTIGWFTVPWIAPESHIDSLMIGALWLALMLCYDIGLARFVFRMPYHRIAADFDITKGNLLGIGMLILFATPILIRIFRDLY